MAQETTRHIIGIFQHRETRDSNLPTRADWTRTSLFYDLMLKGPNEVMLIDNIDALGRWDIDLFGIRAPHIGAVTDEMARTSCRNLIAWADDRFSANANSYFDGMIRSRNVEKGEFFSKEYVILVSRRFTEECKISISAGKPGIVNRIDAKFLSEGDVVSSKNGRWWSMISPTIKIDRLSNVSPWSQQ